jgi:plasmid replication initiation protein
MGTEVVNYDNSLNSAQLSKLSATNANIFFALCHQFKNRHQDTIELSFTELKRLSGWKGGRDVTRFVNNLDKVFEKLIGLTIRSKTERKTTFLTLFSMFSIDQENQVLTAQVSPSFTYLLNDLNADFTRWELPEFLSLRSNYAKTIYRHLKQFRSTGLYTTDFENFRYLLSIPESYNSTEVKRRVVEPAVEELRPIFPGLTWDFKKVRGEGRRGQGGQVIGISFYFNTQMEIKEYYSPDVYTEGPATDALKQRALAG